MLDGFSRGWTRRIKFTSGVCHIFEWIGRMEMRVPIKMKDCKRLRHQQSVCCKFEFMDNETLD